jgi:type III pantothenate kinase
MNTLLIDVGNSQLKWLLAQQLGQAPLQRLNRSENYLAELTAMWRQLEPVEVVVIANVTDTQITKEIISVGENLWPQVRCLSAVTEKASHGVTNSYLQPERLGVDRWLVLIAGWKQYLKPLVVVDCGTAITVDALNQQGQHLGGLIIPGFALMQHSLAKNTFALSKSDESYKPTLANATEPAIANGCMLAAAGLVEKVVSDLEQTEGELFQLLLTGGDAPQLKQAINRPCVIDPELIFKGLQCYLDTHQ